MSSLDLIKKLREESGASMAACKKAVDSIPADAVNKYEFALNALRKLGISSGNKKSDRNTSNGFVTYFKNESFLVILSLLCETDFVAKNKSFYDLSQYIIAALINQKENIFTKDQLLSLVYNESKVLDKILEISGLLGEKIDIGFFKKIDCSNISSSIYVHNSHGIEYQSESCGNILSYVLCSNPDFPSTELKNISMHCVALRPRYLSKNLIPNEILNNEIEIYKEQSNALNKPIDVIEKINHQKLAKFIQENCLLTQMLIMDQSISVDDYIKKINRESEILSYEVISI